LSTRLPKKRKTPIRKLMSFERASATGFPFSRDSSRASSSACSARTSAALSRNAARSAGGRQRQSVWKARWAALDEGYYLAGGWVLDTEPVGFVMGRPPVGAELGFQGCGHCELS
jgi:hypothetical protein